jgi:hypothetical protein
MAYITLAGFKSYVDELTGGVQSSFTTAEDAVLTEFITQAQAEIERVTERKFEAATATRYYTAHDVDQDVLYLDADLLSVTTLTNGDGTAIASDSYWLRPFNRTPKVAIQLMNGAAWAFDDDGRIAVAGSWAFSTTAPDDVKRCAYRLAWFYWAKRSAAGETTVLGDNVVQAAAEYPADVKTVLRRYRRKEIR